MPNLVQSERQRPGGVSGIHSGDWTLHHSGADKTVAVRQSLLCLGRPLRPAGLAAGKWHGRGKDRPERARLGPSLPGWPQRDAAGLRYTPGPGGGGAEGGPSCHLCPPGERQKAAATALSRSGARKENGCWCGTLPARPWAKPPGASANPKACREDSSGRRGSHLAKMAQYRFQHSSSFASLAKTDSTFNHTRLPIRTVANPLLPCSCQAVILHRRKARWLFPPQNWV